MTSLDHLLPAPDASPRCADHAQVIGIRPAGTGIRTDRVVLIETSLPWPKPVFDHPSLREVKNVINANPAIKLWASVPTEERRHTPVTEVAVFDRLGDGGVRHHQYLVSSPDELLDVAAALAVDEEAACSRFAVHDDRLETPVLLVCTQGSHDVCCGSEGARFAGEAARRFQRLPVYRVSHTGGHRFAPTGMTFPDGRMWAFLDGDVLARILEGEFPIEYHRGWWGAEPGPAQVAEAVVRARHRSGFDARPRTVSTSADASSNQPLICTVSSPVGEAVGGAVDGTGSGAVGGTGTEWEVEVELVRRVPTIACRAPGGTPYKTADEYRAHLRTGVSAAGADTIVDSGS